MTAMLDVAPSAVLTLSFRDQAASMLTHVRAELERLQALESALTTVVDAIDPARPSSVVTPAEAPPEPSPKPDVPAVPPAPDLAPETPPTELPPAVLPRRAHPGLWTADERRDAVLVLLRRRGPMRVMDVAREMDEAQTRVQAALDQLLTTGEVARVDHGTYAAVEVQWSWASRRSLVDHEAPTFAQGAGALD